MRRAIQEIVALYSRKDLKREFADLVGSEARRKPDCSAALLSELGLERRIAEPDLPDG
ncbi:MAG TPA: hypothetical protein VKA51_05155 [Rubrobacteraceae bacterium]|nr:hypothetical protein [Rubrobacteraceae bacterium]